MNTGQKLWQEAKRIIPGGNQLLSKRAERFLPGLWPAYYDRAKGCEVWDLDGNHYYDFAQMGVGACVLGYADDDVNAAVIEAVNKGSMCTLNAPEEVALAKRLIGLHPWAEQARFARTGGEACAVAVRIGRAATGKGRVAFCGYHGWHDWYLAANIGDESNLDGQLLPGLSPTGLFRGLKESNLPFNYNRLDELEALTKRHDDIGVIIMEPQRGNAPAPGFLEGVRAIADRIGAVLIFDEVTSGFRVNMGGIHLTYGVEPDIAVFGKALGNGYPIAAIIGRRKAMDAAQSSFISSTMWTERVGYTAALATLEKMERLNVPARLTELGLRLNAGWERIAAETGVGVHIDGIPPLTHIGFTCPEAPAAQTFYTQQMLEKGYLLGAAVYMTNAYDEAIIDRFVADSATVFAELRAAQQDGSLEKRLKGGVIQAGFKRLT
ncbi:aminotransferase class III-fold pyridoxal phosphate-dependent enzyme [Fundidesulfovibrio soli]|uniref:aminotransferase class III-fold pyridoxal phosphate-dependent enzyme n=1 Tax=Fundidesulfovibrio soli TaxID=2922716 RepID=UPI001FAE9F32|nr:aminotransferase class III-fold pyridoxal phosphate-dependent enzyme [Fundidesulfovibrio soli]